MRAACSSTRPRSPGRFGIGDLGRAAFEFVDLLAGAGQRLWQVLPLGPTGYGDSPYQCFSAFAGNPLLISLDLLVDAGALSRSDVRRADAFADGDVDFPAVIAHRLALWPRAARSLRRDGACRRCAIASTASAPRRRTGWTTSRSSWRSRPRTSSGLDDVGARDRPARTGRCRALGGPLRTRDPAAQADAVPLLRAVAAARDACHARSIDIMGDLPIFVAHDSADVWARRELFRLDPDGHPTVVAGVPPDYFSATGQLWGNPALSLGCSPADRLRLVDRTLSRAATTGRSRPHRSLPGFEASWEMPDGAADRRARRVGQGTRRGAVRRRTVGACDRSIALCRREPRRHHAGGGSAP